jgi:signal transduction histidine kinase
MTTRTQQLLTALTRQPDIEHAEVGRLVMWAGLLASALPCALLLMVALSHGLPLTDAAIYTTTVLVYLALLLLIDIPSRVARWLWRHLWLYLLVLGGVALAIQSMVNESFLQPIIFLVPMVYAALAYSAARFVIVALLALGLMNLGVWFSGVRSIEAFLFPTFGYGTFMGFTFAFTRLSVEQAAARREADRLAADLARERDYLARLVEIMATLTHDLDLATVLAQVAADGRALARAEQAHVWLRENTADGEPERVRLAAAVPSHRLDAEGSASERWGVRALDDLRSVASGRDLVLPLIFKGATIGVLELHSSPGGPFAADDARLLQPFVDVAAVAIENARLFEQAGLSATLAERNRLARELHDTIAQGLTAVTMQLEAAQRGFDRDASRTRARVLRAHELARDTLQDVRRSVWTLAAPLVDGQALHASLDDLTQQFVARTGVPATYEHSGPPPRMGHAAATQVLRIVQEALTNVEKHANAGEVRVESALENGELRVWVRDDGLGFASGGEPSAIIPQQNGSGFGLISLRERARLAGGTLEVESAPGAGTQVTVVIPIAEQTGQ